MGMFDYIRYKGIEYQTKDTPHQHLEHYEIRDDGTLWVECYKETWRDDNLMGVTADRHDYYWQMMEDFSDTVYFYRLHSNNKAWEEYKSIFIEGKLAFIENITGDNYYV